MSRICLTETETVKPSQGGSGSGPLQMDIKIDPTAGSLLEVKSAGVQVKRSADASNGVQEYPDGLFVGNPNISVYTTTNVLPGQLFTDVTPGNLPTGFDYFTPGASVPQENATFTHPLYAPIVNQAISYLGPFGSDNWAVRWSVDWDGPCRTVVSPGQRWRVEFQVRKDLVLSTGTVVGPWQAKHSIGADTGLDRGVSVSASFDRFDAVPPWMSGEVVPAGAYIMLYTRVIVVWFGPLTGSGNSAVLPTTRTSYIGVIQR
jgi:hypothetical protein